MMENDSLQSVSSISPTQAVLDVAHLRFLVYPYLLHPLDSLRELAAQWKPFPSFWGRVFRPDVDIPDLSGKVILITGGTAGLGRESVIELAKHNPAHIYLAARTATKAESVIEHVKSIVPSVKITFLEIDLSSLTSVSEAAHEFIACSERLDLLMNNAGIAVPAGTTQEGYEIQFGTNYVGPALLTKLLLPTLLSTAKEVGSDVRIVNLSSDALNMAPSGGILFDKSKLEAQSTWARYGQSKLAIVLYTRELAIKYSSITTVSVHPGLVNTDLYEPNKKTNMFVRFGTTLFGPLMMQTSVQGARNQLWAATIKKEQISSGSYYKPVGVLSRGSYDAQDSKLSEKLWEWTEKELLAKGY